MIALDTNILVYGVEQDRKSDLARSVIIRAALAGAILPLQVIAEFANVCRRKAILNMDAARSRVSEFKDGFTTVATSARHIDLAILLSERYRLALFDALICVVAQDYGATHLLSEDMQDGMTIGTLTILNPFNPANQDRLDALLKPSR